MSKSLGFTGTGMVLAMAAAAYGADATAAGIQAELMHCYGVNACKGLNDCKTADHACAGQSECKGQGFLAVSGHACEQLDGTQEDEWIGQISTSDLVRCWGVNSCKGHSDCHTPENSCAGLNACKGKSWITIPEPACTQLGGRKNA